MTVPAVHAWSDNATLIRDVAELGHLHHDDVVVDATYGRGKFWKHWQPAKLIQHDLYRGDGVDFRHLPEADESVDVVVLDPDYKLNGTPALGDFDDRYGTDERLTWQERMAKIDAGVIEAARVLRHKGRLLLKCQDQVCSGKVRWQTHVFTNTAEAHGMRLLDRFDLLGGGRVQPMEQKPDAAGNPRPDRVQRHAHGRPSTLLVFVKEA